MGKAAHFCFNAEVQTVAMADLLCSALILVCLKLLLVLTCLVTNGGNGTRS